MLYTADHRKAHAAATFFAALILALLLTATVYSVINIDHDCIGEHCSICHNMQVLWSLMTYIAKAGVLAIIIVFVRLLLLYTKRQKKQLGFTLSPVRLFDRMND